MAKRKAESEEPRSDLLLDQDELDRFYMGFALDEARRARDRNEVPIGAVLVLEKQIVGRGHNRPIELTDPTAHAEILALRGAAERMRNYRLLDTTLYVTIEPCAMCAGAIVHARVKRLVYGAPDLRAGGVNTVFQICSSSSLNHQVEVTSGVRADEARALMQAFFQSRRNAGGRLPEDLDDIQQIPH